MNNSLARISQHANLATSFYNSLDQPLICAGAMGIVYLAILINTNALWSLQSCMKAAASHGFRLHVGVMHLCIHTDKYQH